jgi:hypothetical protein
LDSSTNYETPHDDIVFSLLTSSSEIQIYSWRPCSQSLSAMLFPNVRAQASNPHKKNGKKFWGLDMLL